MALFSLGMQLLPRYSSTPKVKRESVFPMRSYYYSVIGKFTIAWAFAFDNTTQKEEEERAYLYIENREREKRDKKISILIKNEKCVTLCPFFVPSILEARTFFNEKMLGRRYTLCSVLPTQKMRQTSENTFSWPCCSNKNLFWDIPIRRSCIVFCTLSENCFLLSTKIGFRLPRNFAQGKKSALMIHDFHSGVNFDINLSHWKKWAAAAAPACFLGKNLSLCPTRAWTTVVVAVAAA